MSLPPNGKLVRDRIPEIITAAGGAPHVVQLTGEQLLPALQLKMAEEFSELINADSSHQLEELADVYEVLRASALAVGSCLDEVASAAEDKAAARGGFARGLWLTASPA